MKNTLKKLLVLGVAMTLSACASLVSDNQYPVAIKSTPDGASFKVTDKNGNTVHSGTTPETVILASGAGFFAGSKFAVTFEKEGFDAKTITLESKLDGWYFGNILFGGLIGMLIVDPATGAMYSLPEISQTTLDKSSGADVANQTQELRIFSIDELSESQRARLVKVAQAK